MKVLITQSMLFPWVGMLEQIRLADVIVHYDDVQFSKGSFTNRVQVKTANGLRCMTVPLRNLRLGQVIDEVEMHDISVWGEQHMALLKQGLQGAPYAQDAFELMREVYASNYNNLGALSRASMLNVAWGTARRRALSINLPVTRQMPYVLFSILIIAFSKWSIKVI